MNRRSKIILLLFASLFSNLFAQGVSRSSGIGLRASYWSIAGTPTRFSISDGGTSSVYDFSGVGSSLYFFSRVQQSNWFIEFSLGAVARVHGEERVGTEDNVEVSAVIPFLLGLRYDVLSNRHANSFQPYISSGIGPYWSTAVNVRNQVTGEMVNGEADLQAGGYAGGGVNFVPISWIALNLDLRYHFVDFQRKREPSGFEFALGMSFMWGRKREIFQIKETKVVVRDIYPAYYQFYNTYPIALVTVKNLAGRPIEVNVRSYVKGYSVRSKDSGFIKLARNETRDIPVTAIFGPNLRDISRRTPAVIDLEVEARAGSTHRKEVSAEIMVHNRNAWNGEIDKLGFFVTPDDEKVLQLSRKFLREQKAGDSTAAGNLPAAKTIFEALGKMGMQYQRDPNIPFYKDDRVQFAMETINLRHGDCDDLVVLYASLLESAGINTAFVEVTDPQKDMAHLYLLFDSGLTASEGSLISSNEKRFIVRENTRGKSMIWIPLETTLVARGFEEAWKAGALEYLQDGVVRQGIAENWVKVIEVE
jgi:hypothetical protein